jgi:glucose-1-phosphate cytidylyltransferase
MKVVILCGGMGTRLRDVSESIPKPLVPVGERPIVWHIMKYYAHHGYKDFVLCLGYKKEAFTDFFLHYRARNSNLTIELGVNSRVQYHTADDIEDWRVTLVDTGLQTMTGGRVRRVLPHLGGEPFLLTYGDGLADVDLHALVRHHRRSGLVATVSAVHPAGRFGEIQFDAAGRVQSFAEKPQTGQGYINGGFMVLEQEFVRRYVDDSDGCVLETDALQRCAADGQLNAYRHDGMWQCMDTQREHQVLNDMWRQGAAWRVWDGPRAKAAA